MTDYQTATLIWVWLAQALFVLGAAGLVAGVMIHESWARPYDAKHRADRRGLSTYQSYGRQRTYGVIEPEPDDLQARRDEVDATATAIEVRVELWNRDLLAGPLFDPSDETPAFELPPVSDDPALERHEASAGDPAYLALTEGALRRTRTEPARPHPARVDTSELAIVDVDELAGVT